MEKQIEDFYRSLRGRRVAFIGTGVTNQQCIELFARCGAQITLCDKKPDIDAFGPYAQALRKLDIRFSLGEHYLDGLAGQEMIMRTPGFEYYTPELVAAREAGAEVTSEMELFFRLCPCKIVAVTGSDGKTTTTTLIAKILEAAGYTVHLGGNIGAPLLPVIDQVKPEDAAVVELSSFQLISMRRSPDTALITNVAPNHLDMHKDMQEYVDAKKNLYRHQDAFSRTVLNWDNDITRSMAEEVRGDLYWFSRRETVSRGTYLDPDGVLHHIDETGDVALFPMQEIRIPGMHNVENFLGVIAALWGEVSPELFCTVAREFAGVEHRIEFVRELDGVKWYNDSIASNPTRTIAGLMSFNQKLCIIAGGYDKKIPFQPLADPVAERVKLLILTGPTADKIEAAVKASPKYDPAQCRILRAKDLPEAVALARQETVPGDIVSLSPACASFDAYPNFEVRGQHFKELVRALS